MAAVRSFTGRAIPRTVALLLIPIMGGCDALDRTGETPEHADQPRATLPAPQVTGIESAPLPPAPRAAPATDQPPALPVAVDTGTVATPLELAELAASLAVPVQGVARNQLRDSYSEARGGRVHEAMDILAPRGTPVVSAADGRLLRLFDSKPGGLMVYATDPTERFILLYGHLDSYAPGLTDGMPLKRGQTIGYVGTTGNAPDDTPHLHFGILRGNPNVSWSTGTPINPYPLYVPVRPAGRGGTP